MHPHIRAPQKEKTARAHLGHAASALNLFGLLALVAGFTVRFAYA
jgi:hypothetical protein